MKSNNAQKKFDEVLGKTNELIESIDKRHEHARQLLDEVDEDLKLIKKKTRLRRFITKVKRQFQRKDE